MRLRPTSLLTLIFFAAAAVRPVSAQNVSANPDTTDGAISATRTEATGLAAEPDLTVMSFNIRYNNPGDGEDAWPHRADGVAALIARHEADIVGLQEALPGQLSDLEERLSGYSWLGTSRGGDGSEDEFSAVLYRTAAVQPAAHGTFWLSDTPEEPASTGWDAALPRIATWARFRVTSDDVDEGTTPPTEFMHLNTHFDHRGEEARIQSARLIRRWLTENASDLPVIVTGDFNALPDSEPIAAMTDRGDGIRLQDALNVSAFPHEGPLSTWNGFDEIVADRRIDFVFVNEDVQVLRHAILDDRLDAPTDSPTGEGRFPSDHLPVLAEIAFRPAP